MANSKLRAELEISALNKTGPGLKAAGRDVDALAKHVANVNDKMRRVAKTEQALARAAKAAAQQQQIARTGRLTMLARRAEGSEAYGALRTGAKLAPAAAIYGAGRAFGAYANTERELTRIGNKAGATREQMQDVRREIEATAQKWAMPLGDVTSTFDSLIESGFEFDEARARLNDMVKVTQALGGTGAETVQTWDALRKSIGATGDQAGAYFDTIAAGSAAGKFEARDLAGFLPELLPVAAKMNINTLSKFQSLVGTLEALRDVSGDSSQTVTSMNDFLEKLTSPDVVKNFKEAGKDIYKELDKANASGEDLFDTMHRVLSEVTKGDARRLGEFFGDKEARRTANLILTDIDRIHSAIDKVRANSSGMIDSNVNNVLKDAKANLDRLSSGWDKFVNNVGKEIAPYLNPTLGFFNEGMEAGQSYDQGLAKYEKLGGSKSEAQEEFNRRYAKADPDFSSWNPADLWQRDQAFFHGMGAYGRGEAETPFDPLDKAINAKMPLAEQYQQYGRGRLAGSGPVLADRMIRQDVAVPTFREALPNVADLREQYSEYGSGRVLADQALLRPARDAPAMTLQSVAAETDALRQALEGGGRDAGTLLENSAASAGSAIAEAIRNAASTLERAAAAIGANGEKAAAAISRAQVNVNVGGGTGRLPQATGNMGQSHPDAGVAGGQ